MTEEKEFAIGPVVYAISKGMKACRQAYAEAAEEYKNMTGKDVELNGELVVKTFSSVLGEVEKSSDLSVQDFLKNYQKFEMLFSLARKFLG